MAKQLIIVDLDFNGNQIQNVIVEKLASAPASAAEGRTFYNENTKCLSYYNGTSWVELPARVTAAAMSVDDSENKIYQVLDPSSTAGEFKFRSFKAGKNIAVSLESGVITIAVEGLVIDDISGLSTALSDAETNAKNYADGLIEALEVEDTETDGQFVTVVSQADGKISVSRKAVASDKVTFSSDKNVFNGKANVKDALEALADQADNVAISEGDDVINISDKTGGGKEISVNISESDKFLSKESDGLKVGINIAKETTGLDVGVKEQYKLKDKDGNQVGDVIKIYNDTSLHNFYLGHVDDKLTDEDASSHESETDTITAGTGAAALVWVMELNNKKYKMAAVDVSDFLQESEFGDGLKVENHIVNVKISTDTESVKYLTFETVDSRKVLKVSGIDTAIANAVSTLKSTIDDYTVNGKKISTNPTLAGSDILATGYAKGTHGEGESPANVAATDTLNQAIGKLEDKIDTEVSDRSAITTDHETRIAALEGVSNAAHAYNTSVNTGTNFAIPASTHKCGTVPAVKVYYENQEVIASVTIDESGNVTVAWNSTLTVSAEHPIKIKVIG